MSNKINKIFKDSSSNGYAVDKDLTDYGSMFSLSSSDLQPNEGFASGFGLFEFDSSIEDINPSNETLSDTYLEYDGNGDIMPKE
tara:strand:+ start:724 stop:975 length:252 start_codon:yes stop_codon:yes gene_type:complete